MNSAIQLKILLFLNLAAVCLIMTAALLGSARGGLPVLWGQGLTFGAALNLLILLKYEKLDRTAIPPANLFAIGAGILFFAYVCWQSQAAASYPAERFLTHYVSYGVFFMALMPIVSRPTHAQCLALFTAALGLVTALCGIAHRLTGSWDFLGHDRNYLSLGTFGFFYYENTYGAFVALVIPLVFAVLLYRIARLDVRAEGPFRRLAGAFGESMNSCIPLLAGTIVVMGAGLIVTNSRVSLLVMICFYAVVLVAFFSWRLKIAAFVMIAASASAIAMMANSKVLDKVFYELRWDRLWPDALARFDIATLNIKLFFEKPWLGWGMGTYQFESPRQLAGGADALNFWDQHFHAHGSYMDLLIEGGCVGFVLGLVMVMAIPVYAACRRNLDESLYRKLMKKQALLALLSFAPMLLSDSHMREPIIVMLVLIQLAIYAASTQAYRYSEMTTGQSTGAMRRPLNIIAVLILGLCAAGLGFDLIRQYKIYTAHNSYLSKDRQMDLLTSLEPKNSERWKEAAEVYCKLALRTDDPMTRDEYFNKAKHSAEQAIRLMPIYAPYYRLLAEIDYRKGDLEGAIGMYRKAIEQSPKNLKYKSDLMLLYLFEARNNPSLVQQSQWNREAKKLYEIIRTSPNYPKNGFASVREYRGVWMNNEQKKYLMDFIRIADKYREGVGSAASDNS